LNGKNLHQNSKIDTVVTIFRLLSFRRLQWTLAGHILKYMEHLLKNNFDIIIQTTVM